MFVPLSSARPERSRRAPRTSAPLLPFPTFVVPSLFSPFTVLGDAPLGPVLTGDVSEVLSDLAVLHGDRVLKRDSDVR